MKKSVLPVMVLMEMATDHALPNFLTPSQRSPIQKLPVKPFLPVGI